VKILTILGARPQFIKAAAVSRKIQEFRSINEIIVHTGQHYDSHMSNIFFDQLDIPRPKYNLKISDLNHGAMTGRMVEGLEKIIEAENPDWVMVYGDTNSTLAGSVAASKLHIPIVHVEAGLRSHNALMPEEINRILTDRVSTLLMCPTKNAVINLRNEGYPFRVVGLRKTTVNQTILNVGDVMYDALLYYKQKAMTDVDLSHLNLEPKNYILCTIHRQENTDDNRRLSNIIDALSEINRSFPVVLPMHPRTKDRVKKVPNGNKLKDLKITNPFSYLEILKLQIGAKLIITDSGGIQKEAYFNRVPCITIRDQTEWIETVNSGWNKLVSAKKDKIVDAVHSSFNNVTSDNNVFGSGDAASLILKSICNNK